MKNIINYIKNNKKTTIIITIMFVAIISGTCIYALTSSKSDEKKDIIAYKDKTKQESNSSTGNDIDQKNTESIKENDELSEKKKNQENNVTKKSTTDQKEAKKSTDVNSTNKTSSSKKTNDKSTSSTYKSSTNSSSVSKPANNNSSNNASNTTSNSGKTSSTSKPSCESDTSNSTPAPTPQPEKTYPLSTEQIKAYAKSYILSRGFAYDESGSGYNAPTEMYKGDSANTIYELIKENIDFMIDIDQLDPNQGGLGCIVVDQGDHMQIRIVY